MSLKIGLETVGKIIVLYFKAIISLAVKSSLPSREVVLLAPTLKVSVLWLIDWVSIVDLPSLRLITSAQSILFVFR